MSNKTKKKYADIKVAAASLSPADREGYMTKQGGSIKNWNKRYFILKDRALYYYKGPKDLVFTGRIDLEPTSIVKEEPAIKKSPFVFSIQTSKRVYVMYPDKLDEVKGWIDGITKAIEKTKLNPLPRRNSQDKIDGTPDTYPQQTNPTGTTTGTNGPITTTGGAATIMSPRVRLSLAKAVVGFLKDQESKVLEFWQIWSESIPMKEDLAVGMSIDFHVATSADMQKLTWRTCGPQNIFIQKMVDFFWNVGAPESEIDRLNDVGALINPVKIGSWIDMSAKGGMDGGWFFPVDIPLKLAVESADPGEAVKKLAEWAESHEITGVYNVGRDMGAAPPRQTEIKIQLIGQSFEDQLRLAIDAFSTFGFPPIPENALKAVRDDKHEGSQQLTLSVITSAEGFVRLGLLIPSPEIRTVLTLCGTSGGNHDELASFEASLGKDGPSYVELQYLMKGFGYSVYKEGFDIVFHYFVGEERSE